MNDDDDNVPVIAGSFDIEFLANGNGINVDQICCLYIIPRVLICDKGE